MKMRILQGGKNVIARIWNLDVYYQFRAYNVKLIAINGHETL